MVVGARLDRAFSYFHDSFSDNSPFLGGAREAGFRRSAAASGSIATSTSPIRASSRWRRLVLRLHVTAPEHGGRDLARLLEWEYWNGRRWRELQACPGRGRAWRGGVLTARATCGRRGQRRRGLLDPRPPRRGAARTRGRPRSTRSASSSRSSGEGALPDDALANLDGRRVPRARPRQELPAARHRAEDRPLPVPRLARAASRRRGSDVRIEVAALGPERAPRAGPRAPRPGPVLGVLRRQEVAHPRQAPRRKGAAATGENPWALRRRHRRAHQSGRGDASACPKRHRAGRGQRRGQLLDPRCASTPATTAQTGSYMLDGDQAGCGATSGRCGRRGSSRSRSSTAPTSATCGTSLSYNDFRFRDHSDEAKVEYRPFQPFSAVADEGAGAVPRLGRQAAERSAVDLLPARRWRARAGVDAARTSDARRAPDAEYLRDWYAERDAVLGGGAARRVGVLRRHALGAAGGHRRHQEPHAERASSTSWGPTIMAPSLKFTEDRYWLRARLEMGGYVRPPRIQRILTNTVEAANVRHDPRRGARLVGRHAGAELPVRAGAGPRGRGDRGAASASRPPPRTLVDLGDGAGAAPNPDGERRLGALEGGRELLRLGAALAPLPARPAHRSGQLRRRHARHGAAAGAQQHRRAGATRSAAACAATSTRARSRSSRARSPTSSGATTRCPAAGGADAETIEEAKARAPMMLRAAIAPSPPRTSSRSPCARRRAVARARCLPSRDHDGEVQVVIVPRGDEKQRAT